MNDLVIYHHLGLGDHFICNGLVREWAAKYDQTYLFCKYHNAPTVEQMYRDLNLRYYLVNGDEDVGKSILPTGAKILQVGFNQLKGQETFDKEFYDLAGVSFEKRWTSFKVNRDKKKELDLIYQLNLPPKFALIHEDQSRGYKIDRSKINLPIVRLEKKDNFTMIDWLAVAELAAEIHAIESSFRSLTDQEGARAKLYFHQYARDTFGWQIPTTKKHWITYD